LGEARGSDEQKRNAKRTRPRISKRAVFKEQACGVVCVWVDGVVSVNLSE
jgi:hypothetical protein